MENRKGSVLLGRNIFAEAFEQFDEEEFFNNLHNQVRNKSYFEKYKGFKTTLLWLSYLFSLISALTTCYAVYWLMGRVSGITIYGVSVLALSVAALFLFFFEKLKRKSSSEFWQVFFFNRKIAGGWLVLSLCLLAISLVSSAFGTKEGVENLAPDPELVATDSLAIEYRSRIAMLEQENAELSKQRNHEGVIYYHVQSTIRQNKRMIGDLNTRILELDKKLEGKNEVLSAEYAAEVKLTAWTLVWVNIAMDLLFEACIAYIWYYYYRSYVERSTTKNIAAVATDPQAVPSPTPAGSQVMNGKPVYDENAIAAIVLATLKKMQPEQSAVTRNGETSPTPLANNFKESTRPSIPIGFYTRSQMDEFMREPYPIPSEAPVQVCTEPQRGNAIFTEESSHSVQTCTEAPELSDLYTVLHRYEKGGKIRLTPYTENQILSRISQYEREIEEAQSKNLDDEVIKNRQDWFLYWSKMLAQLITKQVEAGIRQK